ncbi:MAG: chloride channel protein [Candidatus Methanomethylophilaceae archaeon]
MDSARAVNDILFLVCTAITGAIAGAFVWCLLFAIDVSISFIWDRVPIYLGDVYPLVMCVIGGAIIGMFTKRFGPYPDSLRTVMKKVKNGGYGYDKLGRVSVGALLPLMFGGSVGPEAGLVGAIAGICTWVGDRMKRFGKGFERLSEIGTYAALSAIFTAPLYGLEGAAEDGEEWELPRAMRWLAYIIAIAGAVGVFLLLSDLFGGGLSLPRYTDVVYGANEFLWMIPLILVGAFGGWMFCILDVLFKDISSLFGDRTVLMTMVSGALLGLCGMILPMTMFSGETQADVLNTTWMTMSSVTLIMIGSVKIVMTSMCVNMGWRGGHFFPLIFSGIALGYGMSMILSIDPVFCVCAVTAAVVGGVTRKPLMSILLLFLCFPLQSVLVLAVAAFIGSKVPLPGSVKERMSAESTGNR